MIWTEVYTETVELWEEGTIVLIEGRVTVREDTVQLSCRKASRYQPGQVAPKKTPPPETRPMVVSNGRTTYNSKPTGNGKSIIDVKPTPVNSGPLKRHRLIISIKGTQDEKDDLNRLHRVIYAIKEYTGRDEASLRIINNGKTVNLKLPNIYTGYCSELHEQLVGLVGESGLIVETLAEEI